MGATVCYQSPTVIDAGATVCYKCPTETVPGRTGRVKIQQKTVQKWTEIPKEGKWLKKKEIREIFRSTI